MGRHVVTKRIAADPDRVWALLGDFTNIDWIPLASSVELEGGGPGIRPGEWRRVHGSNGMVTQERLISTDEGRRTIVYGIEDGNPLPVSSWVTTAEVQADPSGGSLVTWTVDYETEDEATVTAGTDAVYGMIAGWLSDAAAAS